MVRLYGSVTRWCCYVRDSWYYDVVRISVVNTKGGVGKTTTSMMLAMAAHRAGHDVEVWDADPQGSATLWAMTSEDAGEPLPFEVRAANVAQLRRVESSGRTPDADMIIIDTPPGDPAVVQAAIDIADLVVIPTLASGLDIQRVWPTLEASAHRHRAVLLTSAEPRTRAHTAVVDVLAAEGEPLFSTVIPRRQGVRAAFGTAPRELFRYDELLKEIEEVMR